MKVGKYECFTETHRQAMELFHGEKGVPYFSLVHHGVKFNEYVGVIQVGKLCIEVLPKADKDENKDHWRGMLIDMLRAVNSFHFQTPSETSLTLKSNAILDLYFEIFVGEVECLIRKGLIKKYRQKDGNSTALKGSLLFSKNIQHNLVHKERFFVRYTTYDKDHEWHRILYKTILLINHVNTNANLKSKIGALLLDFPEMPDIAASDALFNNLQFNRKTDVYKKAIEIARLLLLNYHPDIKHGQNHVLALMFDMNKLWEQFVYVCLRRYNGFNYQIKAKTFKYFWQKQGGNRMKMIPDILIRKNEEEYIVLDTKWKNIGNTNPQPDDLRQMYMYSKYHMNAKTALVYPGEKSSCIEGQFYKEDQNSAKSNNVCRVMTIAVAKPIKVWQRQIAEEVWKFVDLM